ncbi:MarR family transcriptional regulator [Persicobacter diffluens]|uniref:MarR family transcriptional regulator n=2 Tax=Persicobacter diffluens TaxID=981 RepID=A0AAN4W156_9BACT|nr:MarR family transcriptional regulator [Persicobacter diffluens]
MRIEEEIKTTKFKNLKMKAILNTVFTANWFNAQSAEQLRAFDLSLSQYNILRILRGSYPKRLPILEIKARMLDKTPNTTRLVTKLLEKRLVEREQCESDRRVFYISISKEGLAFLEDVDQQLEPVEAQLNLTEEEAKTLSDLLDKVRG